MSPVWDTCLAAVGLLDSGLAPDHPALQRAGYWMLDEQVTSGGDWQVNVKGVEPGGWLSSSPTTPIPTWTTRAEVLIALKGHPA